METLVLYCDMERVWCGSTYDVCDMIPGRPKYLALCLAERFHD
jgi:hypothetical protein